MYRLRQYGMTLSGLGDDASAQAFMDQVNQTFGSGPSVSSGQMSQSDLDAWQQAASSFQASPQGEEVEFWQQATGIPNVGTEQNPLPEQFEPQTQQPDAWAHLKNWIGEDSGLGISNGLVLLGAGAAAALIAILRKQKKGRRR